MSLSTRRPSPIRCEVWGIASPPQQDRTRVVVVDDHPDTAHVMALALKIEGFEVTTALDGTTGMLRVAQDEPDVVLLDITLPDMSGVDVARHIREVTSRNIAIIAVTSLGFERDRETYRLAGFDAFCMKPVEMPELVRLINRVTGKTPAH